MKPEDAKYHVIAHISEEARRIEPVRGKQKNLKQMGGVRGNNIAVPGWHTFHAYFNFAHL